MTQENKRISNQKFHQLAIKRYLNSQFKMFMKSKYKMPVKIYN